MHIETTLTEESVPPFNHEIGDAEVSITPEARSQLEKLFAQVDDDEIVAIRVFVSGGGCSGMTYGMTFADTRTPYDRVLRVGDFDVYVDSVAMNYLDGVEIDYVNREVGASFVFNNVFAATGGSGTCGACGMASPAGGGCG